MKQNPLHILRDKRADVMRLLLGMVFIVLVFVPLIIMFTQVDGESLKNVFTSPNFSKILKNSLVSTTISTVITLLLAYGLALCVERTNIRFKSIFGILFVLPMLIPSISNGMGLVILFGNNGILTNLFGLDGNIYGLPGIVVGSVLYAFPVAYLMLSDVMKYQDRSAYEAAQVLGMSKFRQFTAITLPYLRKPLISVIFSTFTLIVTDYGVPLMVGGHYKTIPVEMYNDVLNRQEFGKGAVYGSLLLIPAVVAFIIDLLNKDRASASYVTKPIEPSNRMGAKLCSYVLCIGVCLFVLLPIASFVILAFTAKYPSNMSLVMTHVQAALSKKADVYLINSLLIALCTALVGTAISFITAYMTARMKSRASRFLHLSSITSAAIPGVVLGLSYALTFKGSAIYGTLMILVMANLIHFVASPYLMMYNSLSKLNENLEDVGHTMDISRAKMIRDVFIPQCKGTLLEMFSYFFVNCMMTISAVSFLATIDNKPVSMLIPQFETQLLLECAAVVSLAILAVNLLIKGAVHIIKTKRIK